jgi:hypothetical protein
MPQDAPKQLDIGKEYTNLTDLYFSGPAVMTRSEVDGESFITDATLHGDFFAATLILQEDSGSKFKVDGEITTGVSFIEFTTAEGEEIRVRALEPDDWPKIRPDDKEKIRPVDEIAQYLFGKLELPQDDHIREEKVSSQKEYDDEIDVKREAGKKDYDGRTWVAFYSSDDEIVKTAVWDDTAFSIVGKPGTQFFEEARQEMMPFKGVNPQAAWESYTRDSSSTLYETEIVKLSDKERKKLASVHDDWYENAS